MSPGLAWALGVIAGAAVTHLYWSVFFRAYRGRKGENRRRWLP